MYYLSKILKEDNLYPKLALKVIKWGLEYYLHQSKTLHR
jgi:hypothetical protein